MDKVLHFIDHLCLDDQLYWRVPLLTGVGEAEIRWQRDLKPAAWTVRTGDGAFERAVPTTELIKTLTAVAADCESFERQAGASVLTQAVFAEMVRDGAIEIFGTAVVARSVADTRAFLQSVSEAAAQFTQAPQLPAAPKRLQLVRD